VVVQHGSDPSPTEVRLVNDEGDGSLIARRSKMSQLVFDQDTAQRLEGVYRIRDAIRRRRLVREALGAATGERILDVGCGPGFFCAELAEEVGPSGSVLGLDTSAAMLALAARRCASHANIELRQADAGSLPAGDGDFDAALCVQVLEYVPDATAALSEMRRVLRPGGRIVVWDVDWATLSIRSEDPALTQRILRAWDEHLTHRSLPRTLAARLRAAGFVDVGMQGHLFATADFDGETYGGATVSVIGAFVAGRESIPDHDATRWLAEQRELGERGEFYFTVSQFCFAATKPE
jgi:arsenite methyltransferase